MKAFEKQWAKMLCSNNQKYKMIAEINWRAALGWVLNEFSLSPIGNKAIREELEGGE